MIVSPKTPYQKGEVSPSQVGVPIHFGSTSPPIGEPKAPSAPEISSSTSSSGMPRKTSM